MIGLAAVRARGTSLVAVQAGRGKGLRFRLHEPISRIAARFSERLAHEWATAVTAWQHRLLTRDLEAALATGDPAALAAVLGVPRLQRQLAGRLEVVLAHGAQTGLQGAVTFARGHGLTLGFNVVHPRVIAWAKLRSAKAVTDIAPDVRATIRGVTALGAAGQLTVAEQATLLRTVVGLPAHWAQAPQRLRDAILAAREAGRPLASAMAGRIPVGLRGPITTGLRTGTLTPGTINQAVQGYADRLVAARAEMIARTESLAAANWGVHEAWRQAVAEGELPEDVRRFWVITPDERLCEVCAAIPEMNPDGVGLDEPFDTPEGPVDDPPAPHPHCRCATGLLLPGVTNP